MVIKTETCWERSEAGAGAGRQKVICGQDSEEKALKLHVSLTLCILLKRSVSSSLQCECKMCGKFCSN